jgi:2-oxoglutarate/2-oxoacid ferredoxin oxidoreductase subunit alpha
VRLALCDSHPISFFGRMGGIVPLPDEVLAEIKKLASSKENCDD